MRCLTVCLGTLLLTACNEVTGDEHGGMIAGTPGLLAGLTTPGLRKHLPTLGLR
jgi:hypothetical protein